MRLSKLKLAGFKSFVDPTTVHFPGNLTGVVGPNGCGKSNIIDAVRWVMGEISAKHLRGNDMTDVIFNGSGGRKPVGAASVELVFDNSDGALTGPYANYAEVSLKRQVTRDGQSTYYINGAKCRRKDITQLFLGTGLGSRSYAIIEQGMISRLIEAKPDDMRAFLEEAAGISKYKERRRETENRISHTRENLDRLNDIREELDKQIRHLQRQAATARRYQALKEEERRLQAELLALKLRDLDSESGQRDARASEEDLQLQAALAQLRETEAAMEAARERHAAQSETLNEVQGRYYQAGADVSRTEQAIAHARELRARQRTDLEQAEAGLAESIALLDRDQAQVDQLTRALAELEPGLEQAREREHASHDALDAAEHAMQEWQHAWESFSREASDANQRAMVERARIEQLESRLRRSLQQQDRVLAERDALAGHDVAQQLESLAEREQQAAEEGRAAQERLTELLDELAAAREAERAAQAQLDRARSEQSRARGQLVSLEALQQAALGTVKGKVVDWLAGHALGDRPRLAQQLVVEPGWARAVETVLGSYLEAVCVDGLDAVASLVDDLAVGQVTFVGLDGEAGGAIRPAQSLLAKVQGPAALESLVGSILAVDTLPEALARRAALAAGESIITRDGVWIGRHWLRVSREQDSHAGVIEREKEIRGLREALAAAELAVTNADRALQDARSRIKQLDDERDDAQAAVNRLHRSHVDLRGQFDQLRARAQQTQDRLERLTTEAEDLAHEIAAAEAETRQSRQRLEGALEAMQSLEDRRAELEGERESRRAALADARARAQSDRAAAQEAAIKVESRRSSLASIATNLERVRQQIAQLQARREDAARQLAEGEAPLADQQRVLEGLLASRVEVERQLAAARSALEEAESEFRRLDEARASTEARVETARQAVNAAALAAQETRVRRESILEQFAGTKFELEAVLRGLVPEATAATWEQNVAEVAERIARLGQVNLAAIDEFKEASERKEYLDKQFADLTEALNTLEQAIRKIDKETRSRFQDTFDRVNAGLQQKFPRLFGGGNAYLELTGEDVLSAGVAVMARPPGKRNSTISQLSGGEKALTAVALVFSIFDLNPAPFCLLDEVDAPLDEHNVGRFCEIVRDMSERVQFLFITHNKNTMELAKHLVGVTMNEPGVSRLVAVDVDEALRMAAAG
ncbi:MAG: chromosome segregation protein SMC [Steroidobacteraceae bacterium]|nr:chromosome segregation protein SMC [Steroidobacteraceae bacterium]